MKYLLDLSKVEFEKGNMMGELPKRLCVEDGNHFLDYDVIKGQIPSGLLKRILETQTFIDDEAKKLPMGFDYDKLPEKAILRMILDEDDYGIDETDKMKSELTQGIIQ